MWVFDLENRAKTLDCYDKTIILTVFCFAYVINLGLLNELMQSKCTIILQTMLISFVGLLGFMNINRTDMNSENDIGIIEFLQNRDS